MIIMENSTDQAIPEKKQRKKIKDMKWLQYSYMLSVILFMMVCGYVLVFAGSLFLEAINQGWYKSSASEFDNDSLFIGYLLSFASITGLAGALMVLSTKAERLFRFKVLLFFPALMQTVFDMIPILLTQHQQLVYLSYLLPVFLLCLFVFLGAFKRIKIPYMS